MKSKPKIGRWKIDAAEFDSLHRADLRFAEALGRGWAEDWHRLPFLVLWLYVARQHCLKRIGSPGAAFSALLKRRAWFGRLRGVSCPVLRTILTG